MKRLTIFFTALILFSFSGSVLAQNVENLQKEVENLQEQNINLNHKLDVLQKTIDDVLWFSRMDDIAFVDKVYMYGPPPANVTSPTARGAYNPVKFWSYVFIPKDIDYSKKYPLLVFPHGGVHSNFSTYYYHIVRELMAQGYIVVAPEYRGSTGYGRKLWEQIDYGGLEVQDAHASRNYMIENYDFVDKRRVGILGWSHGGLISLLNAFEYPNDYQCVYAGVPVSDLISRLGYMTDSYRKLYSADYHIGSTVHEDIQEYKRRSPAWNAHKLEIPLLVYTNTNDDDVDVLEVEHLIKSLKAEGKKFEYKIFKDIPGGHSFDRMDTKHAKEVRLTIYDFLAKHLKPPKVLKSIDQINSAAYRK